MKKILNETNHIRRLMGLPLIKEETLNSPQSEEDLKTLLSNNGFELDDKSKTSGMVWKYTNKNTLVSVYKNTNGDYFVSQKQFYNPKTELSVPTSAKSFTIPYEDKGPETWNNIMTTYIQSKNIYDPSWSLDAITKQINKIESTIQGLTKDQINTVIGTINRTINSVEDNIKKWLVDQNKQLATNRLNQVKTLAKEKGLKIS